MLRTSAMALGAFLCVLLSGCSTTLEVIDTNIPPIILDKSQKSGFYITDVVTFPAGTYPADFKTTDGVYYRAPSKMVHSVLGGTVKTARRGGIFIPFAQDTDHRLGVWFDHQEGSGGLIGYGLSSPTSVSRLHDPIEYSVQGAPTKAEATEAYKEQLKNSLLQKSTDKPANP